MDYRTRFRSQQLLAPLRESIIDKPPFISGTLQLPESYFSLLYRLTKDGLAARFGSFDFSEPKSSCRHSCHRYINFANAHPDELEQLTQACEPASFGMKQVNVLDETYCKAGKMDPDCFSPILDVFNTDLIKIIRGYLLEGTQSTKGIKVELYELNVYGTHLIPIHSICLILLLI
jgi:hypothetical protein